MMLVINVCVSTYYLVVSLDERICSIGDQTVTVEKRIRDIKG